jgi:hypothetical protein
MSQNPRKARKTKPKSSRREIIKIMAEINVIEIAPPKNHTVNKTKS